MATYYISTGSQSKMYTLRYRFIEQGQRYVGDGLPCEITSIERDYYVCNLSTDKQTAIDKVRERVGSDLTIDFDLGAITRSERDWSIFQGGKYAGKSIHEVRETDANYLIYIAENCATNNNYAKTVELIKSLMAHELESRATARSEADTQLANDRAANAVRLAPIVEILNAMGNTSPFIVSMREQLVRGENVSDRAAYIVCEICAKQYGRRNSKAFNEAFDKFNMMFPASIT